MLQRLTPSIYAHFGVRIAGLVLPLFGCGSAADNFNDDDAGVTSDDGVDSGVGYDAQFDTKPSLDTRPSADVVVDDTGSSSDTGPGTDTGSSTDTGPGTDTAIVDSGTLDTGTLDTGMLDTGMDAPVDAPADCSGTPLAIDPSATLDPLKNGPLSVGHKTFVVPKLNTLTSVNVRVTYPTNTDGTPHAGKHAWVMFHHAVHGPYPGVVYDKYDGIFDRWASHGFIVFSIDGARVFFPTASGSGLSWTQQQTVAQMMNEAITYFLDQQKTPTFELACRLDARRLAVSGHSRGGGAALLVPTVRTDGALIKGYVGFQPVDPEALSPPAGYTIPGFDIPELWLDSALDGDVVYPISALQYSRARSQATHVTILGSKHTYTLDTPFPDQGGTTATITPDEHKAVCNQYGVAFLRARVRDASPDVNDLNRVFGPGGMTTTASSGNVTLRWKTPIASVYAARFDEATGAGPGKTDAGDAITTEGSVVATSYETYTTSVGGGGEGAIAKLIHSVQLTWGGTLGALVVPLRAGALTSKTAVAFEVANPSTPAVDSGTSQLAVEIVDSLGGKFTIDVDAIVGAGWHLRPHRLSGAYLPLAKVTGVDLSRATAIRFVPKTGTTGNALLDLVRIE